MISQMLETVMALFASPSPCCVCYDVLRHLSC